jgi:uncharacterized protein
MNNLKRYFLGILSGGTIGILGGLMGLGGAEFRLPVLVGLFRFKTLQGIIINLVVSSITVFFSLLFRSTFIPPSLIGQNYHAILNLLAGSLIGAFIGVKFAIKINPHRLDIIVFIFLILLGILMIIHPQLQSSQLDLSLTTKIIAGIFAGFWIGVFSSLLGIAGGELIIPTIIILYAVDIKLAGSLSLCVSFPTVIIGIMKYRQNQQFMIVRKNSIFIIYMAIGSIIGVFIGSRILVGISPKALQIILGTILILSGTRLVKRKNHSWFEQQALTNTSGN